MATKRANGEGTIYRRKDGRYEAATYVPVASGGHKRLRIYGRSRAEVHEKLVTAQRQATKGIPIPDRSRQLGEYLEYWLLHVVQGSRRPSTYQQYAWVTAKYLHPELGTYPLDKLSVALIQTWLDKKSASGESSHRVRLLRTVLSAALTRAQREELVHRNVARLVELPRYKARERTPWTVDEAKQFLAATADHELYPAFLLLMLYGMRRGEVLGLRWCDVDLEQGVLHVRNNLQRIGRSFLQGPVKTDAGKRDLPLLSMAREALLDQREACEVLWPNLDPEGLVFVRVLGQPLDPDSFRVSFQRLAKRNNIRTIAVHDVRHTTATLLKDLGVPARDAQLILGHSDIATTQQIYQHASMESRRSALERVEAGFRKAVDHKRSNVEQDGAERCRQNSRGCRQFFAFTIPLAMPSTPVNDGAPEGIRTPDLWYRKSVDWRKGRVANRAESALNAWRTRWILGGVAVRVAVRYLDASVRSVLSKIAISQSGLSSDRARCASTQHTA